MAAKKMKRNRHEKRRNENGGVSAAYHRNGNGIGGGATSRLRLSLQRLAAHRRIAPHGSFDHRV
jgi:hypothetical protein